MQGDMKLLIPVLLPLIAGGVVFFLKDKWTRMARNVFSLAVMLVNAAVTLSVTVNYGWQLTLWNLTETMPVYFYVDQAGALFAGLIAVVWTLAGLFSFEYMKHEGSEHRFYCFYLMTLGVLMGLCFSGNIVTFYMFYELMTLISLPLVMHSMTREAVAAGIKYLIYSTCGAALALFGMFFLNSYLGTLAFVAGGSLETSGAMLLPSVFLMLVGFGAKAGMFPLNGWLPTAHPVAPAPASAVLSGVITKAGVLGSLRVVYYLVGAENIAGTWVQYAWMTLAVLTVFMGSMLAFKEPLFKKRLAYSTVSQVSYVLLGLATLTESGVAGSMLHVVFHSVIKNCLFLSAGAIIYKTGKTRVAELDGMGRAMPRLMGCYTVASLALVGIPPLCGFVSKWYLATGAMVLPNAFSWLAPATLLVSAILTAGYLLPISIRGYFPGDRELPSPCEPNATMLVPTAVLAILTLTLGVFSAPLMNVAMSIASRIA